MKFPLFSDNYTRDVLQMYGILREKMLCKNDYIQKNKHTNRVTYLAKSQLLQDKNVYIYTSVAFTRPINCDFTERFHGSEIKTETSMIQLAYKYTQVNTGRIFCFVPRSCIIQHFYGDIGRPPLLVKVHVPTSSGRFKVDQVKTSKVVGWKIRNSRRLYCCRRFTEIAEGLVAQDKKICRCFKNNTTK